MYIPEVSQQIVVYISHKNETQERNYNPIGIQT